MVAQSMQVNETAQSGMPREQQLVLFQLENEDYGVDIYSVQRLIQIPEITPVPRAPKFVAGVIEVRGDIIPVINLKSRFGFQNTDVDRNGRVIITEIGDQIVGFLVDAISEVTRIAEGDIEPPSRIVSDVDSEFIAGVGKQVKDEHTRLIIILDLEMVLDGGERSVLESLGTSAAGENAEIPAK